MKLKQVLLFIILHIVTCFLSFSLFAQPTTVGLLAHFSFAGNTTNYGPANVTASPISTTYTAGNAGVANSALQFGGSLNSYVDFVDNGNLDFTGAANFTVSFAFFFNGSSTGGLVDNCLNYGGWGVWLWSTVSGVYNIQFNYRNNSVGGAATTNFTTGVWHHVAAVRNNGIISVYIDGAFRASASEGTMAPSYPINMIAGAMAYASFSPPRYNPFGGKIDELRIYNRALSAAEIAVLSPNALPLQLGNFTALKQSNAVQLYWETLNEQNTSRFEIERSTDGINYTTIGHVNAAGNSQDMRNYSFADNLPLQGTNFYRLKMIDIDNKFSYSRVVAVKNSTGNIIAVQLFPNPATDIVQLQIPASQKETATVSVANTAGQVIIQRSVQLNEGDNAFSIPLSQFPNGQYYLIISKSSGRQSLPFIKNR